MTQRIMITPVHTAHVASSGLKLEEFVSDTPWSEADHVDLHQASAIDGVSITPLPVNSDGRGALSELLTTRRGPIEPIVHIYQVTALAGSIRAWVYHEHQSDRLAFCNGQFEIALYDIRPASPTINQLVVFRLGREQPALLRIPPRVIHGVCNLGKETSTFVNMPTRAYDHRAPDKRRLRYGDPRVPYRFNVA
jgi:dTDP-4-dehydrorhamnose 3,5-epimerase